MMGMVMHQCVSVIQSVVMKTIKSARLVITLTNAV